MSRRTVAAGVAAGAVAGYVYRASTEAPRVIRATMLRAAAQMHDTVRQAQERDRILAAIPEPHRSEVRRLMVADLQARPRPRAY